MRMKIPKKGSCDPLAPLELPHSLHAFHRVSPTDELNKVTYHIFPANNIYLCLLFFGLCLYTLHFHFLRKAATHFAGDSGITLALVRNFLCTIACLTLALWDG